MRNLWRLSHRQRWRSFPVVVFIALVAIMLGLSIGHAPRADAAGNGPLISWDKSMIYPGQNNGNPWGPVGENALIHGQGFPANLRVSVILVPGNSNQNPALCSKAPAATLGNVTTSGAGAFQLSFTWPGQAGGINSAYSVCSLSNGLPMSYRDGGPFTVLANSVPSIAVSPNSVQPGSAITISGQNWVPPQQVNITVTGSSQLLSATPTSNGINTGTFSLTVNIPASAQPGGYVVSGFSGNNVLHAANQNMSITTPATPTPTATPSPTPTVTATATSTATVTAGGTSTVGPGNTPASTNSGSSNSGSTGGPSPIILIVFIAVALVLLTSIGLIIFMVLHRAPPQNKRPTRGAPVRPGPYNGGAFPNTSYPASPNATPGNAPYDGFVAAGWQPQPPTNPSDIFSQSTQFAPGYSQPGTGMFAPNNPAFPPASPLPPGTSPIPANTNTQLCMSCGKPLLPNAVQCDHCGMPANIPGW